MSTVTKEYDDYFKMYTARWLEEWDWLWLKSQGYAESLLQPDAVSNSGARGIMQLMPGTWYDCKLRLRTIVPANALITDAQWNICAGVYYMGIMRNSWAAKRSEDDRRRLAQASYNAGFGNILEAQKKAGGVNDYASIIAQLPMITGTDNAKQTTTYVERIESYYNQFKQQSLNETGA